MKVDEMKYLWNYKLMKWQVDGLTSWWNEKLIKWKVDKMTSRQNDLAPVEKERWH
jgi:hypothetical protein